MVKTLAEKSLALHKKLKGKVTISPKIKIKTRQDLSMVYTPGVATVSAYLFNHKDKVKDFTFKGNSVAVISDGSAVLGLGNVGPEAAFPVMEGKCLLFKHFAGIDAIPIVLSTQEPQKIIETVMSIAPTFGGINLEDIAAPKCFVVEETLRKKLNMPVIHDDQWGAATVVLAALINALKIVNKKLTDVKIVISGAGAAGTAVTKILSAKGARNILVCDRQGIIYRGRNKAAGGTAGRAPASAQSRGIVRSEHLREGKLGQNLPPLNHKEQLAKITNPQNEKGTLADAMKGADVFIGLSSAGLINRPMIQSMNKKSIIFALANPIPEIMPDEAKKAGAFIAASGRSDFPNQVNNALVFPGLFRGALDNNVKRITLTMLIAAAQNLADLVKNPTPERIIPSIFDKGVVKAVASAIK